VVLSDRTLDLQARLEAFYHRYADVIHSTDWIRLYLHAGLRSLAINRQYTPIVEKRVIERICIELRHACELPDPRSHPITGQEREAVWTLHGGIFYYGVRKYVYQLSVAADYDDVVRNAVTGLLSSMPALVSHLVDPCNGDPS